jgi:hypothetical protein
MKTILPWLLAVLLGAALAFGYTVLQQKNSEITQLTQQLQALDALKAENESLKLVQADAKELERLRKENLEIYRLRNENAQLRSNNKPKSPSVAGLSNVSNFSGDPQTQIEQLQKENLQLHSEIEEFQTLLARQGKGRDCITNLRVIQGAKERWAQEQGRAPSDVPTDADLFGEGRSIAERPVCPQGGFYNINAVGSPPTCSYPGHIMPQ